MIYLLAPSKECSMDTLHLNNVVKRNSQAKFMTKEPSKSITGRSIIDTFAMIGRSIFKIKSCNSIQFH